jgi:hypothetical protein
MSVIVVCPPFPCNQLESIAFGTLGNDLSRTIRFCLLTAAFAGCIAFFPKIFAGTRAVP